MISLERLGLNPSECLTVYKALGVNAAERISENPYLLCSDKVGLRFERADEIADSFPREINSLLRKRAGIIHILRHNLGNGHTCLPREKLILPALELLGTEREETQEIIDDQGCENKVQRKPLRSTERINRWWNSKQQQK